MTIVTSSANRYYTFYRRTAFVVDERDFGLTFSADRQPSIASYMELIVTVASGGHVNVTITVSGNDEDGNAATENIAITAASARSTTTRWSSISQFAISGTYSGTKLKVRAVSGDGTVNMMRYSVAASRPAVWNFTGFARSYLYKQGQHEVDSANVLIDYETEWTPRIDDVAVEDSSDEEWEVFSVREERVGFGYRPHHYRLRLRRLQS